MKKRNVLKKIGSLTLAACLLTGAVGSVPSASAAPADDSEWREIQSIVGQYQGEWNDTKYEGLFTSRVPNTALMGNGDLGVASGGDDSSKTFYISKGDFWTYKGSPVPIGGVTIKQNLPQTGPENVALRAKIKACGWFNDNGTEHRETNLVDGYDNAKWCCTQNHGDKTHWAILDLGSAQTIANYVLVNSGIAGEANHNTVAYELEYLENTGDVDWDTIEDTDAGQWKAMDSVTGNTATTIEKTFETPITARYVRLHVTKAAPSNDTVRIHELKLFTPSEDDVNADPQKTSLAYQKPATCSGQHPDFPPSKAVNGQWGPGYEGYTSGYKGDNPPQPGPWWLAVDLEEETTFNRFVVRHDAAARPKETANITQDFQLQVRNTEEEEWRTVYTVTGNHDAVTDIILDAPVTARYVRLYVTKGTQETTADSRNNPRARIGQFELYHNVNLAEGVIPAVDAATATYNLGGKKTVSRYILEMAEGQGYKMEASLDGAAWQPVDSAPSNTAMKAERTVETFEASYIRVTMDDASKLSKLSLFAMPSLNEANFSSGMEKVPFHEVQDILNAEVRTQMGLGGVPVSMRTWTSATENTVITELTSKGDEPVELQARLWAKADSTRFPVTAENSENSVTVTRSTPNNSKNDEKSHTSKAALSAKIIGAESAASSDGAAGTGDLNFTLEPGATVYIVTTVGGGGQTYNSKDELLGTDPIVQANELLGGIGDEDAIDTLAQAHAAWWKEYWSASYIKLDTSDSDLDTLMKYYYGAQYMLGCTIREGKVAPGLYGVWHTTDSPSWNSDYHLNYNFISTFYGVNTSNRVQQSLPAVDAILDYVEQGMANAGSVSELKKVRSDFVDQKIAKGDIDAEKGIENAVLYPVGIGPWGMKLDSGYHNEALNAAFSAYPMIEYYNYTQDETFLRDKMYDYLKKCIAFYEAWLEEEDGKFVLYAGYNEGSWSINPAVELSVLKSALQNAIKASELLNVDADKRADWQHILDNLAPQPTAMYDGKKVLILAEKEWKNNQWVDMASPVPGDGNCIPLESIIPGEQFGYYSTDEELQIAQDTIDVFAARGAWSQINNFPKLFANAVNMRYPAQSVVQNLANTIRRQQKKNLCIDDNVHGVEKGGATEAINNMMLLSDKGVIKVFPNWLTDKDAEFVRLREKGAFVVSAAYDGEAQRVSYVDITSEAGKDVTIASPWAEGMAVTDDSGNAVETTRGTAPNHDGEITYTFATEAGRTYQLRPAKTADEAAAEITGLASPEKGATKLTLPTIDGFTVSIKSSSNENVIDLAGNITPPASDTEVTLVLTVTRNGQTRGIDQADTKELTVTVPGIGIWRVLLRDTIEKAEEAKPGISPHIVPAIKEKFESALQNAKTVYAKEDATDEELMEADEALLHIMHYLDFTADKTGLTDAIAYAETVIDSPDYLNDAMMAAYKETLQAARDTLADPYSLDADYEAAIEALEEAKANLNRVPDLYLDALREQVAKAEGIDQTKYIDNEALSQFKKALQAANDLMKTIEDRETAVTQSQVDEAAIALHNARAAIRLIPNKNALKELLDEAGDYDLKQYTAASGEVLSAAIKAAQAVYNDPLADETMVKAARAWLQAAIDDLELVNPGGNNEEPGGNPSKPGDGNDTPTGDTAPIAGLTLLGAAALGVLAFTRRQKRK